MRVLFYGDSITQGFWDVKGGWVGRLREYFDTRAMQDLAHNVQPEIFNLGVSGDTTRNLLARVENETKVRIWPGDPVVAVIAIGTNDDLFEGGAQHISPQEFKQNLQKIVEILQPLTQNIILVGNPACDESRTTPVFWANCHYTNAELERSERTIAEVATQNGLPYVPVFKTFKARVEAGDDLLEDGLHPNAAGHQLIVDIVKPIIEEIVL